MRIWRRAAPAQPVTFAELRALDPAALRGKLAGEPAEARPWIEAAARYGLVEAQLLLGQLLLDGVGGPRDAWGAYHWFAAAASTRDASAINMLGRCFELGWGVSRDVAQAAQHYRNAAELGLDWGQYNYANLLLRGRGVPRDRVAALDWYRKAATQGHAKSMNVIGRFYEEGWEVARNPGAAAEWYRRAAAGGDFRAQYNLATLLAAEQRIDEAAALFSAALRAGSEDFRQYASAELARSEVPIFQQLAARK